MRTRSVQKSVGNLQCLAAGELARWIKDTTPNDRTHVISVLREAAAILKDELTGSSIGGMKREEKS